MSVIVCFHNEIFVTLLRCIHSIYNRSPKTLLHEIVLVNDNSTFPELFEPLRTYLKNTFGSKITLVENKGRQGLIKARSTGAKTATGDVILFLDSHMEVFNGWLPPLLGNTNNCWKRVEDLRKVFSYFRTSRNEPYVCNSSRN